MAIKRGSEDADATANAPPRKRISQAASNIIAITVTDDTTHKDKTFYVYEDLLMQASPYFRAALENDNFREGQDKKIDLAHIKADTMEPFIDWLFTGKLEVAALESGHESEFTKTIRIRNRLGDLYIFGDAHDVPDLRRATLNILFDVFDSEKIAAVAPMWAGIMWSKLPRSSPLAQLLVDIHCRFSDCLVSGDGMTRENKIASVLSIDFLSAIYVRHSVTLRKIKANLLTPTYILSLCDYHEHANEQERAICPENIKKM